MRADELPALETAMVADIRIMENIILAGRLAQAQRLHGQWSDEARQVIRLVADLRHLRQAEDKARQKTSNRADYLARKVARNEAARREAFLSREVTAV